MKKKHYHKFFSGQAKVQETDVQVGAPPFSSEHTWSCENIHKTLYIDKHVKHLVSEEAQNYMGFIR